MPTDHACQSAAEFAAQNLNALRAFLHPDYSRGADAGGFDDWSTGAAALLVILAGLHADPLGELTQWHACIGDQIREALDLPVARTDGFSPGRLPRGWEALALVQHKAQELLTDLADRSRLGRPGELSRRLELVEDAFAGALRRMAVPEEESVRCAAALSEAAGSLFGLRPSPLPRYAPPPPAAPTAPESPRPPDWKTSGNVFLASSPFGL